MTIISFISNKAKCQKLDRSRAKRLYLEIKSFIKQFRGYSDLTLRTKEPQKIAENNKISMDRCSYKL